MRARERTHLSAHSKVWVGTPDDLARIGSDLQHRVISGGAFEAVVTTSDDSEQVTTNPADLASVPTNGSVTQVEMTVRSDGWPQDPRSASITVRVFDVWVHVYGHSEVEARTMLGMVEQSLRPNVPRDARWREGVGRRYVVTWLLSALVPATTFLYLPARTAAFIVLVAWLPLYLILGKVSDYLLPTMELYKDKPRIRRFAWQLAALVLVPAVVSVGVGLALR